MLNKQVLYICDVNVMFKQSHTIINDSIGSKS